MMRRIGCVVVALSALAAASEASAQAVNLSGQFQCVRVCQSAGAGQLAFVTQNGFDLNLVNEAGISTRAWIDWPGHFWTERWNTGAIYTPDGATIQFDNGAVWQRYVPPPPPPPPPPPHKRKRMHAVIVPNS